MAGPAHAQSTGTLQGSVTDSQSAVMPGVSITVRNTATGLERATVTDAAGQYVAASLAPGHYAVTAHIEGFQDQTREADLAPDAVNCSVLILVAPSASAAALSGSRCCADPPPARTRTNVVAQAASLRSSSESRFESELLSRLQQLDWIAIGIFQLDLFAAWARFHLIAKIQSRVLQLLNSRR